MKTLRSKVNLIMAAAGVAWLSVTAKRGVHVVFFSFRE